MGYRLGIDTGGTFTDFVVLNGSNRLEHFKVASTPTEPVKAVTEGLKKYSTMCGKSMDELMAETDLIVHGTTIATNAVIERKGPVTGLICTENFRDVLVLRDSYKWNRWNLKMDPPKPFVPRYLTVGIKERINSDGEIIIRLDEQDVYKAIEWFKKQEVKTVAVSLLWSIVNPTHEKKVSKIIKSQWPEAVISISTEVQSILREWPRTCATVLNAYLKPVMGKYLKTLQHFLNSRGFKHNLLVVQSNGGGMSVEGATEKPVYTLFSGPSMAPVSGIFYGEVINENNIITVDMGGTSFDVCVITKKVPSTTQNSMIVDMPTGISSIDVNTIGAGGGTIAWVDSGGRLRVGPESAGAHPGPACYEKGGTEPTITDADLVLGYLNPQYFLGGEISLNIELAKEVIRKKIAKPLGMDVIKAAYGIVEVVNRNMANGIEQVTVRRGIDPRVYALVVGGGAGPVHAGRIAQMIGISRVLIPKIAGEFCALGMILADTRHDYLETYVCDSTSVDINRINQIYQVLEIKAIKEMEAEGVNVENVRFERLVDMRYPKQVHELMVPLAKAKGEIVEQDISVVISKFHKMHEQIYTYSVPESKCEMISWRLRAIGVLPTPSGSPILDRGRDPSRALRGKRKVYFHEDKKFIEVPIFDGAKLAREIIIEGPAIIEEPTTTVVVHHSSKVTVNQYGDYFLEILR